MRVCGARGQARACGARTRRLRNPVYEDGAAAALTFVAGALTSMLVLRRRLLERVRAGDIGAADAAFASTMRAHRTDLPVAAAAAAEVVAFRLLLARPQPPTMMQAAAAWMRTREQRAARLLT